MDKGFITNIIQDQTFTNFQYKIILSLMTKENTSTNLAQELNVSLSDIQSELRKLINKSLLTVSPYNSDYYYSCNSQIITNDICTHNKKLHFLRNLIDNFDTLTPKEKELLDSITLNKYLKAIEFICNEFKYTINTLFDATFAIFSLFECTNSSSDLYNFVSKNTINRKVSICQNYYLSADFTFLNKKITEDYITKLFDSVEHNPYFPDEHKIAIEAYEEIVDKESVKITNIEIIELD